jgi:TonB family protein
MKQGPLLVDTAHRRRPDQTPGPVLLVRLEPSHRIFFRNLKDLFWRRNKQALQLVSQPGVFWPDVFVSARMPWTRFVQSGFGHVLIIAALWGSARFWPQRPQIIQQPVFHSSDVVYYDATEYLAPLDTGGTHPPKAAKGDPAFAPQPIISVPPEADNRTQTVVAPPKLKLEHDVPLPNVVAWARPQPTIPTAAVSSSPANLKLPALPSSVVAPPPDVKTDLKRTASLTDSVVAPAPDVNAALARRDVHAPQAAIVEPPPSMDNSNSRRVSDINIGHSQVVAPAPQLPMSEQRASANLAGMGNASAAVVPPPPSAQGSGGAAGDGRLIALNLHPAAPTGPVDVPAGNRRGTFAATPEGKPGAVGTPDISGDNRRSAETGAGGSHGSGNAAGSGSGTNGVPTGLFVGSSPKSGTTSAVAGGNTPGVSRSSTVNSSLIASATPPRVSTTPRRSADLPDNATEVERKVFGDRKFYAMTLNVPNLNSAGGSWVMHFAELKKEEEKQGDLVAPVATQEVDPGYPLELMKQNVQGVVMLSAVIHSDGSVGDVKILRGVDDRLDQYATSALARWRFRPATKNGDPIALQAVVMIPFHPTRTAGF